MYVSYLSIGLNEKGDEFTSMFLILLLQLILIQWCVLAPVAQSVECPHQGMGGYGFDPGPRYTKVVKMVLAALCLALRLTG